MSARRGSLALRLLGVGLVQVAVIAAMAVWIAVLTGPSVHPDDAARSAEAAVSRVRAALASREPDEALEEIARDLELDLSVRDGEGHVVATTVEPALAFSHRHRPPPPPPDHPRPFAHSPGPPPMHTVAIPIAPDRTLLVRATPPPPRYVGPLLTLLTAIVVIGAGAYLSGRWIVRPLHALAGAARRIGEGDLNARTGLARSDELGTVARSFDDMAERIEELLRAERELLANVSHELRTPLARIRVAMDLAAEGDAEAARLSVAEIATDLSELEAIVDDILVAMRFEVGGRNALHAGLPLSSLREVTPAEIAERAIERFRARHPERRLEASLDEGGPTLFVDPVLFRRVLDNLLENADKYTPDRDAPIALRVDARGGDVTFAIADRGIGIAKDDLGRVFSPFFRAERSRARGAGGVGLGLTLAKRIVEAHGGHIEIESELGRGTTVRVTLEGRTR